MQPQSRMADAPAILRLRARWSRRWGPMVPLSTIVGAAVLLGLFSAVTLGVQRQPDVIGMTIETRLSGIEINRSFPQDVIAKWGTPTSIEDMASPVEGVGQLNYWWTRSGVRLQAVVLYYTKNGQRCESPIETIRVWGTHATPDGFGRTGSGLALGDGLDKVRAVYGVNYRAYRTQGSVTDPNGLPARTLVVKFAWASNIMLELVFDKNGNIARMELSVQEV